MEQTTNCLVYKVILPCPSLPGFPNSFLLVQPSTSEDENFYVNSFYSKRRRNFFKQYGEVIVHKEFVDVVTGKRV